LETIMADDVKAAPKSRIDRAEVEKDISYIGARLREKSTYAGLSVLIGLLAPHFAQASELGTAISYIGIGLGLLIAIFFPEKGSPVGRIDTLGMGAIVLAAATTLALSFSVPARAQNSWGTAEKPVGRVAAAAKPAPAKPAARQQLTTTQVQENPLLLLQNFTEADLQAALADATANNDTAAVNCYNALLGMIKTGVANPLPAGPGLFQALQKARDAKALIANLNSPTGPLANLNNACAPLVLDAQNTLLGLGVGIGLVASPVAPSVAAASVPGALAAFLAALPVPIK
jgi:hypothetical protein